MAAVGIVWGMVSIYIDITYWRDPFADTFPRHILVVPVIVAGIILDLIGAVLPIDQFVDFGPVVPIVAVPIGGFLGMAFSKLMLRILAKESKLK